MSGRAFDRVKIAGLTLAGVDASTKYDGSPVLKRGGRSWQDWRPTLRQKRKR